jgi:hypothetical protein
LGTDDTFEQLGLRMQVEALRLEKWVKAGLAKLYPGVAEQQLMAGLSALFKKDEGNAYETDQIWAELVHKFKAVGHTVDLL